MTLEEMKQIDPASVDRASLVDIGSVKLDSSQSREEQALSFLQQIKNPYLFRCGEVVVQIAFTDTPNTLEDVTEMYIRNRQQQEYVATK